MRANTAGITNGIITQRYDETRMNVLTIQEICRIYAKAHTDKTHVYLSYPFTIS